jgi:hypothetical protein
VVVQWLGGALRLTISHGCTIGIAGRIRGHKERAIVMSYLWTSADYLSVIAINDCNKFPIALSTAARLAVIAVLRPCIPAVTAASSLVFIYEQRLLSLHCNLLYHQLASRRSSQQPSSYSSLPLTLPSRACYHIITCAKDLTLV